MKLTQLFKAAIDTGIEKDPRGAAEVGEYLKDQKKKHGSMPDKEKKFFDEETTTNPYNDSRVSFDSGRDIKKIIVGVDMESPELVLVDRLNEKGMKIDAVMGHHPTGRASSGFTDVMSMQSDIFNKFGVTISAAEAMLGKRMRDVNERFMPGNHYRASDAAKLLNISLFNIHTPADNCVVDFLQKKFDMEKPKRVSDIMDMLYEEPEYAESARRSSPPVILVGDKSRRVQKVFVDMTGGTEGPADVYKKLCDRGVDTVVGMHFSGDHKKAIEEAQMNAVIAGHISSDSLGLNILLDGMIKKAGAFEIIEASGFTRYSRIKRKK
jgi:hypothetical protein